MSARRMIFIRRFWIAIAIVAVASGCGLARRALAYTGGPQMIEVLGWDPDSTRLYFHAVYGDESAHFEAIYHFDLRSRNPEIAVRDEPEPADSDWVEADSAQSPRLAALRSRLQRMAPILEPALPTWVKWTEQDTVVEIEGRIRRFRVTGVFDDGPGFDVISYGALDVCTRAVFAIPGRPERVWLISFRGRPDDAAQVEAVRLVGGVSRSKTLTLAWRRDELP